LWIKRKVLPLPVAPFLISRQRHITDTGDKAMTYLFLLCQILKNAVFITTVYNENLLTPVIILSGAILWIPATLLTFALCKTRKRLLAYDLITSTLMVVAIVYFRAFSTLPTFASIASIRNLFNVSILGYAFQLVHWYDVLFFIDIPLLIILKRFKPVKFHRWTIRISAGFTAFALLCGSQLSNLNLQRAVYMGGFNGYVTALCFIDAGVMKLTDKQTEEIKTYFNTRASQQSQGEFKGKNLVIILTESLENFAVQDKTIAPNINLFLDHSYYFEVTEQVQQGMSSDAELMLTTGILPVRRGNAFENYPANTYPQSLPKLFQQQGYVTQAFHADSPEIWNWKQALTSIGFQECFDKSFFTGHVTGIGVDDEPFLQQVGDRLQQNKKPFMAFVVTTTSHMPFATPGKPFLANKTEDYKQAIRYTDNAIGQLLKKLPADTIVVITGDHESLHKFYPQETAAPKNNKLLPFIIYHQTVSGLKINVPAGQIDIMPTVASLFGLTSNQVIGKDLFTGTGTPDANHVQVQISDMVIRSNYFKAGK
jgi:lipoteichoic acid synthase